MFFQSIYQMITAGTDLNINIRKVDNSLSVAVMPRRNSLKEDTRQNMVPLVVNGTPAELDMGFPADHTPTDTESAGTACQCGEFRETGRKGNGTSQIIQGSNNTGRIKGNQGKTGKDGKAPQEG